MSNKSIHFETEKQTFDIEGLPVSIFRIKNFDELIEKFFELDESDINYQDERLPYWADLWHSAIALGRFLVRENLIQPSMKVTEIGCGLGFSGIVAGLLGADMAFTDYLPEAVNFVKKNWELNSSKPARFELMDWRFPKEDLAADLILAADVAYEKTAFEPLLQTFNALCDTGKSIIISEPNRKNTQPFFQQLKKENFKMEHHVIEQELDKTKVKVNIYKLTKTVSKER